MLATPFCSCDISPLCALCAAQRGEQTGLAICGALAQRASPHVLAASLLDYHALLCNEVLRYVLRQVKGAVVVGSSR